jgi:hypothetical protein
MMALPESFQMRPGPLAPALAARLAGESPAAVVRRDLGRYYDALALGLANVALSPGEAGLIVDALNGTRIELTTAQMLGEEIEDALADGLAAKWDVDGPRLVATILGWSLIQRLAVVDAVERFWAAGWHASETVERLTAVGLVKRT